MATEAPSPPAADIRGGASGAAPASYFRIVRTQFMRERTHRISVYVIIGIALMALAADFIASERPILLHLSGKTYILPNVVTPGALRAYDNTRLLDVMGPDDWAVFPLVPWGVNSHDLDSVLAPPSAAHW